MAEADLDTIIRSIAKKQIKTLTVAAKARQGRLNGMAAKAKDQDAKARYRHLAKATLEHANAAARRLQMSAENTADAYKRAMAKAAEEAQAIKTAKKAPAKKPAAKKAAKKQD
jgi:transcriptional regulator of nitric oxide reductase